VYRVPELIPVLGIQPAGDRSYKEHHRRLAPYQIVILFVDMRVKAAKDLRSGLPAQSEAVGR